MFFDKESFKQAYLEKFAEAEGKTLDEGTSWDKYHALVLLLKEKVSLCRALSNEEYSREKEKQVYYFSMEFLIGKLLPFYLVNMEIYNLVRDGLADLNIKNWLMAFRLRLLIIGLRMNTHGKCANLINRLLLSIKEKYV